MLLSQSERPRRRVVLAVVPHRAAQATGTGMRNEGRLVQHLLIRGEWLDSFVFALLRREWQARGPAIAA